MNRVLGVLMVVALAGCGGDAVAPATSSTTVPPSSPSTSTTVDDADTLAAARGEVDACDATIATEFALTAGSGPADPEGAVRSALAGTPVDWGDRYAEAAGVLSLDGSDTILRVLAPGPHFELTVAVVEVAVRDGGDWVAIAAYHCAESDLPYPRPPAPGAEPSPVPLLPTDNALDVTVDAVAMSDDALELLDGMVLGGLGDVLLEGDPAGAPFIVRVEDGTASILRGRWCGTWWGPAPLDDGAGGAIALSDRPDLVRCTPGSTVSGYGDATPLAVGTIDGRRVIAAISWGGEPGVITIDVEDGSRSSLFDLEADERTSVAFGGGRWLVGVPGDGGDGSYVVLGEDGSVDTATVAPPWAGPGTRIALSDDGRHALLAGVAGDEFVCTVWDLVAGVESSVVRFAGAHEFVYIDSVDISPPRAIVNLGAVNGEFHPFVVLVVDLDTGDVALVDPGFDPLTFAPLEITRVVDAGLPWLQISLASFLDI